MSSLHIDVIHKLANVSFFKDIREAHVFNFMFIRKKNRKLLNNREIWTRSHDAPLYNVSVPRCEAYKHSVGFFGAVSWNNIPPVTRNAANYLAFKQVQKLHMLENSTR